MNRTLSLAILVAVVTTHAVYAANSSLVVAHTFDCGSGQFTTCPQGGSPETLIQASDGNFYGAAQVTQLGFSQPYGGTLFSISPAGRFTLLYTFQPGSQNSYPDGSVPGPMIEGPDGSLYGTTFYGGTQGFGVLYRFSRAAGFQVLHQFGTAPNFADGFPGGSLVAGQDGNVYGVTAFGGTGSCYQSGCGTLFRVTPSTGKYEVVFNFGGSNGSFPSFLLVAPDGTLVGLAGGLFHYTPTTGAFKLFPLSFPAFAGLPSSPINMILGPNQELYGLYTIYDRGGAGMYHVALDGTGLVLFPEYRTTRSSGDPQGIVLASDGNFWVPDFTGGSGVGDLITLSPSTGQVLQTLSFFGGAAPVGSDAAALIQAKDGTFWGSSFYGGKAPAGEVGYGTVYRLSAGLPAP